MRRAFSVTLALAALLMPTAGNALMQAGSPPSIYNELADEVSAKMLQSSAFTGATSGGKKARIVVGDVVNNSDDERIRVSDIFNEVRNQIVASGSARLFAPGELNVDFVISPELTSQWRTDKRSRLHCLTLQLTLTTVSGEYVAAHSAERCT